LASLFSGDDGPLETTSSVGSSKPNPTDFAGPERADRRKESTIDATLLCARLLLVLVFATAGAAKLADRAGSRQAIADFGVPAALAGPLVLLLPLAELAVAAALIPVITAWWGAVGALVLLSIFAVAIGANLARGRKPECHCFGQLHAAPAGWSTLARNAALAVPAALVVWLGWEGGVGPSAVEWVLALSAVQVLGLLAVVLVVGLLAARWWWAHRMVGLPLGAPAPTFGLPDLEGEMTTLDSLRSLGRPVLLFFTDPGCEYCAELLPEVGRWQYERTDEFTVAIISCDDPYENREMSREHGLDRVLLQEDWEVAEAYRVTGTPSAVLVTPEGAIGSFLAEDAEEIEGLVSQEAEGSKEGLGTR
jgi:methylamine dehydrogenase accessory protein MauD